MGTFTQEMLVLPPTPQDLGMKNLDIALFFMKEYVEPFLAKGVCLCVCVCRESSLNEKATDNLKNTMSWSNFITY